MAILKSLLGSKKDDSAKAEMGVDTFNLIKIFRAMSYRLGETVSDLLDNSIDALADEVRVTYKLIESGAFLIISDNGAGLNETSIDESMSIGSNRKRDENDLGKFGMGMKLSSITQADTVILISKQKGHKAAIRTISYKHIEKTQKVELLKYSDTDITPSLNASDISDDLYEDIDSSGSTLILTDFRKSYDFTNIAHKKRHNIEVNYLREYLSRTFEHHLKFEEIKIFLNEEELVPLDPFYRNEKNSDNKRLGFEKHIAHFTFDENPLKVEFLLLPPSYIKKDLHTTKRLKKIYDHDKVKQQGVYVYRNNRLIKSGGGWEDIFDLQIHSSKECARVVIHAGPKWDEKLRLNVTKTDYEFPQEFKQMLLEYAGSKRKEWGYGSKKLTDFWDSSRDKNIKPPDIPNVPKPKPTPSPSPSPTINPVFKPGPKPNPGPKPVVKPKPTNPNQIEIDFSLRKINSPQSTDLIYYSELSNSVSVNISHPMYKELISEMEKIINNE
tara:strand:- start:342 stop:1835 length:1494 start_codon:yes stop_codon:yes gene_type:complete